MSDALLAVVKTHPPGSAWFGLALIVAAPLFGLWKLHQFLMFKAHMEMADKWLARAKDAGYESAEWRRCVDRGRFYAWRAGFDNGYVPDAATRAELRRERLQHAASAVGGALLSALIARCCS